MNFCNDRHSPLYRVKYKPVTLGGNMVEWLVCERCFGKQEFFGAAEEIESIVSLRDHADIGMGIDHLSILTKTVTRKLCENLLMH